MVIAGGLRSFWGPLLGALFIQIVSEMLRDYAEYRMVLFAILVLIIIRTYQDGIYGMLRVLSQKISVALAIQKSRDG